MAIKERRQKIAWFLVYLLWIFTDVELFWGWDTRHLIFLGAAWVGTVALCFAEIDAIRYAGIAAATCTVIAVIAFFAVPPLPPPAPRVGWLQPANEPTPPNNMCVRTGRFTDAATTLMIVGDNGFIVPRSQLEFTAITLGTCQLLSWRTGPNGLLVNAEIYDATGKFIGRIVGNGYSINAEENLVTEVTGDLTTLIVHDRAGNELLYVKYVNQRTIRVRGKFSCPTPQLKTLTVTDEKMTFPRNISLAGNCADGGIFAR